MGYALSKQAITTKAAHQFHRPPAAAASEARTAATTKPPACPTITVAAVRGMTSRNRMAFCDAVRGPGKQDVIDACKANRYVSPRPRRHRPMPKESDREDSGTKQTATAGL